MGLLSRFFGTPTRDEFARRYMKAMRDQGHAGPLTYEPAEFIVRFPDGWAALSGAYADYCRAPRTKRREVLHRYAGGLLAGVEKGPGQSSGEALSDALTLDVARSKLLPRVHNLFHFHATRAQLQAANAPAKSLPWFRPFAQALGLGLIVDLDNAMVPVAQHTLDDWKLTADEALAIAKENLWSVSKQDFTRVKPGLFMSPWQDSYDPSRMYLYDLIWQLPVQGKHVALCPNRIALIVTGDEDAEGLVMAAALAEQMGQDDRPVSGIAFRLDGSEWSPWLPDSKHPAYVKLCDLKYQALAREYEEQGKLLRDRDPTVLVASYRVSHDKETGQPHAKAFWIETDTDELLPEADAVLFVVGKTSEDAKLAVVGWDEAMSVLGPSLQRTDDYPPRYLAKSFPTPAQLDELGIRNDLGL